jgi:cysteine desulfurase
VTIYLDYAATTPVDPRVAKAMGQALLEPFENANPASATHGYGIDSSRNVERMRLQVARLVRAQPHEIIFTSGATESNNLAILGAAAAARRAGGRNHFVSARTEHKSVLDAFKELARHGARVTWLEPDEWGRIPPEAVRTALRDDTLLVSIMHANNEVGCINDIAQIAAACLERGALLHTDASQSAGKIDCDVGALGADFLSLTAHKMYGPKGIGALYVRERARPKIAPLLFGGGHERGLRPGTLATHQISGFGFAVSEAMERQAQDFAATHELRARLMGALEEIPGVTLNTLPGPASLPGIVNASFAGVEGESLVTGLTEVAVATGSACSSATREPSYVLRALGRDTELAQSSLRLSFGRFTTAADIDAAVAAIRREVSRLRALAGGEPLPGEGGGPPPGLDSQAAGSTLLRRSLTPLAQRYFCAPARPPRCAARGPMPGVRTGRAGRRADGAEVLFELEIADGIVKGARFNAYGCPHTLAVASWLCEVLTGSRLEAGPPGTPRDWAERFAVPPEKLGRLLVVEDALRAAYAA